MGSVADRHPALKAILADRSLGGWALDEAAIDRLIDAVIAAHPSYIGEFGSGISTLVLARLLADLHGSDEVRLLSFDQDPAFAEETRAALAQHGLTGTAAVVTLPLGASSAKPRCYELTDEARALLRDRPPELILVDGPTQHSGASRLGVLELVAPYAAPAAVVLLDDALRDPELRVGEAWAARPDTEVLGIRLTGKGLLEARIGVSRSPQDRRTS